MTAITPHSRSTARLGLAAGFLCLLAFFGSPRVGAETSASKPAGPSQTNVTTTVPATTSTTAAPAGALTEAIRGRLVNPEAKDASGKPAAVPGIVIVVTDADGNEVGTVTSDEDGRYELGLPGPGDYKATLQKDSLPAKVRLTDPDKVTLSFRVNPNQSKPLLFPFGKDTRQIAGLADRIIPKVIEGVRLGLILAMCAIGLSLIYGTTGFTNFAHGEMVTFGALSTWFLNQKVGLGVIVAGCIGAALSGLAGAGLELGIWSRLRRRRTSPFGLMTVSFGLSLFLIYLFQYLYGSRFRPFSQYYIQPDGLKIGRENIPPKTIITIVLSVLVLTGVGLFLQRARFGKAMRAVADNQALASSSGIDVDRVILLVWIMGSALAGLGGVIYSIGEQVHFQEGSNLLLLMFAGITLGGLGTSYGAAIGCFLLGLAIQLSTVWVPPSLKNVGALVVLIVILLVKPQGVFGRRERVG